MAASISAINRTQIGAEYMKSDNRQTSSGIAVRRHARLDPVDTLLAAEMLLFNQP